MKYEEALQYSKEIIALLRPYVDRCEVAGSVRRKKQEDIKDIELVVVPKRSVDGLNLFHWRMEECLHNGLLEHGDKSKNGAKAPFGDKYYRLKYDNGPDFVKLDIFVVIPPAQWGPTFLIRTGDADFSHEIVSVGKPKINFVEGHLEEMMGMPSTFGVNPIKILQTPEEINVFKALGLSYIDPELRTATSLRYALAK